MIKIGGCYMHIRSENIYTVLMITNRAANGNARFPLTVVYENSQGEVWSRPLSDFVEKFEETGQE